MKVLILSMTFPYPPKSGGKVRVYNLIRQLSRNNEIHLISLIHKDELNHVSKMYDYCKTVEVIPIEHNVVSRFVRIMKIIISLFTGTPAEIAAKDTLRLKRVIKRTLYDNKFDIIQVEWIQMAQYVPFDQITHIPKILTEHDVAYVPIQRRAEHEKGLLKLILSRECRKMKHYEEKYCKQFEAIVAMSDTDKQRLLELDSNLNVSVIPNGVSVDDIKPNLTPRGGADLLFIGWMKHYPNKDAINFFLDQIYPALIQKRPDVKVYIVGQHAPAELLLKAERLENVIFTGYVEDISKYLSECTVYICPLRIGGGTRLKILEAMAAGMPIVSTSIGAEGLGLTPDEHLLVADEPADFVRSVCSLLEDPSLRGYIAHNARTFVEDKYNWKSIAEKQTELYETLVER